MTNLDWHRSQGPIRSTTPIFAGEVDMRKRDRDWLNPIAMAQLKQAVEKRAKSVYLDGRKYLLTYGYWIEFPISRERRESVCIRRADGHFAPFGYVAIKRILDFDFENPE